jgi:hypothetical protein
MTHSIGFCKHASFCLALVLLAACASQREPAQKMIGDIEAAVSAASADAAKFVPAQLIEVQAKLDDLKTALTAQDYRGVLARGPAVLREAQDLAGAAAAGKADLKRSLEEQWSSLASLVPQEEVTLQNRMEMLRQRRNRKIARDVDLDAVKSALESASSQWSKAQGAFGNGNLEEAVAAGKDAESRLASIASALKIELPAGAGAPAAAPAG